MATANRASHETGGTIFVRVVAFIAAFAVGGVLLAGAVQDFTSVDSAIWRYRSKPQPASHVFVRGTLRTDPSLQSFAPTAREKLPPVCLVDHEVYGKCGKSSCWKYQEGMLTTQGYVEVEWASSDLPKEIELSSSFSVEPLRPKSVNVSRERHEIWKARAQKANLGFSAVDQPSHRIVERCLPEESPVFLEGCMDNSTWPRPTLTKCPGKKHFGIVCGSEGQPAIDDAADNVAMRVGGAFLVFVLGLVALLRTKGFLVDALSKRSSITTKKFGVWWALLALPPVMGFVNILFHSQPPTTTWYAGKGGSVLALTAATIWLIIARALLLRRRTVMSALAPVLSIGRSPLASASGTTELNVRAQKYDEHGIKPILGNDVVAYASAKITEKYRNGKNVRSLERGTFCNQNDLKVTDESGEGVLHLAHSVLHVELRKASFKGAVPPRLVEQGKTLPRHENHVSYDVEEQVIHEGEQLYVFGDVSDVNLQADNRGGYRAVRGSPTLGGGTADSPPVLVYSGDEHGLVDSLQSEARFAHRLAIAAAGVCGALCAVTAYLISL